MKVLVRQAALIAEVSISVRYAGRSSGLWVEPFFSLFFL